VQVDLGSSQELNLVILEVGDALLQYANITVGDTPNPADSPCSYIRSPINGTVVLVCRAKGRYLRISSTALRLCRVQVYASGKAHAPRSL
jgi:hypothetical protein